jgi:hypothetical protein
LGCFVGEWRGREGLVVFSCRLYLKCDGTRAETRFRLSAKRTSIFKSAGASVHPTTGSRGVHISGSNAGYTMFRCSVKSTGYPLHLPVSLQFPSRASPSAITFQLDSSSFVTSWQVEFLSGNVGASHFRSISVFGLVYLTRDVQSRLVRQLC